MPGENMLVSIIWTCVPGENMLVSVI